ncbi:MAG: alkaline phosphatase family protein [Planctomycetota bacterium]
MAKKNRTLLIGWDGADWRFARRLIDRGAMPALSRFVSEGATGNIATLRPMLSPMLWNSIATGKRASKHGVHGFCEVTPDGRGVRPVQSGSRACKALWNIASQSGLSSNVVGWYASHPAERVCGAVVSNDFQTAVAGPDEPWPVKPGAVHPPELEQTLAELRVHPMELGRESVLPFMPFMAQPDVPDDSPWFNPARHRELGGLMRLIAQTTTVHTSATWLMEHTEWDFMAVYYEGIDRFAHAFMEYHPPRMDHVDPEAFERYRHVMSVCYQFHDMMLAATLRLVGPETNVILVSDHGYRFDDLRPTGPSHKTDPVAWHHPLGMLAMQGPDIRAGQTVLGATLLDIAPTVLSLMGLPVGLDMDGKPLTMALSPSVAEPDFVLSWELEHADDGRQPAEPGGVSDPEAEREALRQLVELGYLDELSDDQEERVRQVRLTNRLALLQSRVEAEGVMDCEALALEVLSDAPDAAAALDVVFGCQVLREEFEAAASSLEGLRRARVGAGGLALREVQLLVAQGDLAAARRVLVETGKEERDALAWPMRTGEVMLAGGDLDAAQTAFREALNHDPDHAPAWDALAQVSMKRGHHEDTVSHCLAALERIYFLPRTHYKLGLALRDLGQPEQAILALQVAVLQAPQWGKPRRELDLLLRQQGRTSEAIEQLVGARSTLDRRIALGPGVSSESEAPSDGQVDAAAAPGEGPVIYVVSGLPRSGTSLMMQLLQAAGVPPFTDGKRLNDENNPRGYFEHEAVRRLQFDPDCLRTAGGHAVKVIHALTEYLPAGPRYRMLWMQRDLGEVLASQSRMVGRSHGPEAAARDRSSLKRVFELQAKRSLDQAQRRRDIEVRVVSHRALVQCDTAELQGLIDWLGMPVETEKLAAVIDPGLYRQRQSPAGADASDV